MGCIGGIKRVDPLVHAHHVEPNAVEQALLSLKEAEEDIVRSIDSAVKRVRSSFASIESTREARVYAEAEAIAAQRGGHYMDQFTHAERATDWRGNNNIAESIFAQMARERFPLPRWVVVSAGTGGTRRSCRRRRTPAGWAGCCPQARCAPGWPWPPPRGRPPTQRRAPRRQRWLDSTSAYTHCRKSAG